MNEGEGLVIAPCIQMYGAHPPVGMRMGDSPDSRRWLFRAHTVTGTPGRYNK